MEERGALEVDLCNRLIQAINGHDADELADLLGSEYVDVDLTRSRVSSDASSFLGTVSAILDAFPDASIRACIAYVRDSRVGIYWIVAATQTARVLGVPPTHRKVRFCGFTTLTIRRGKFSHGLHLWDLAGLLRDLRLVADLTEEPERFDPEADLFPLLDKTDGCVTVPMEDRA
ncbi:MAG: ester cyclase [Bacteroidetes bacterium]|nr:ester cyclase [Bacteroidota bacterium]